MPPNTSEPYWTENHKKCPLSRAFWDFLDCLGRAQIKFWCQRRTYIWVVCDSWTWPVKPEQFSIRFCFDVILPLDKACRCLIVEGERALPAWKANLGLLAINTLLVVRMEHKTEYLLLGAFYHALGLNQ